MTLGSNLNLKTLAAVLTGAALAYVLWQAISLPLMHVRQFYVFTDTVSLFGIINGLNENGDTGLAALIVGIGIVAPLGKCALLACMPLLNTPLWKQIFHFINSFSAMDAFLVALTVFFVKVSGLSTIELREGASWLIAFVIGSKAAGYAFTR